MIFFSCKVNINFPLVLRQINFSRYLNFLCDYIIHLKQVHLIFLQKILNKHLTDIFGIFLFYPKPCLKTPLERQ